MLWPWQDSSGWQRTYKTQEVAAGAAGGLCAERSLLVVQVAFGQAERAKSGKRRAGVGEAVGKRRERMVS